MSGTASVTNTFASAVTATGAQLDTNYNNLTAYLNDPTNRNNFATDTGNTNTVVLTFSPAVAGYTTGLEISFKAANTNSGAMVVNTNGLGNKNFVSASGSTFQSGAVTIGNVYKGIYDGTQFVSIGFVPNSTQPIRHVFTSGSSTTYVTPVGVTRLEVRLVGGGGGGGAQNTNNGTTGNTTSFGILIGGGGGPGVAGATGGSGGTASGGDINITGGAGNSGAGSALTSGAGGTSVFGGAGAGVAGGNSGGNASPSTGAGGGGGGNNGANAAGGGGGAGGYVEKLITSPAATYTYTVAAAANGGIAGTNAGGNGASGIIIVDEYYN